MSEWIIPKKEDIDTGFDNTEIHVYFESNDFGARYVSLEGEVLEHVKKLLDNLNK